MTQVKLEARKIAHLIVAGQPDQWSGLPSKTLSKLLTASQFEKLKRGAEMVAKGKPVTKNQSKRAIRTPTKAGSNVEHAGVATINMMGKQLDEVVTDIEV